MFRVLVTAALMFSLFGCEEEEVIDYRTTYDNQQEEATQQPAVEPPHSSSESGTVYICTGDNAKSYHTDRGCDASNNCQAEIIEIDRSEIASRDREDPCNRCVGK